MAGPKPEVDGAALREALTAAAQAREGDTARQRAEAVVLLSAAWRDARADARAWLDSGASGLFVARFLAEAADAVIGALHDVITVHLIRARNPTEGERLTVVAVGGYGRAVLAPFSDVDLLLLRAWKPTPHVESVGEAMLPMLWDIGFKVGWAARSVDESLRAAREDLTVRTALLEARPIAGDLALFDTLASRFRAEVVKGTERDFVAAKLAERDERHARAGRSRYLVEPDVKAGKGALRDLHTVFWIARYLHPETVSVTDAGERLFTASEGRAFLAAFHFLWTVRCRLHFAAGRAEERLGFQWQPRIAAEMGYRDRPGRPAVERFMRRYFLAVREAGVLTRILCARLETEEAMPRSRGLSRFLRRPRFRRPLRERAFRVADGRLALKRPDAFEHDPADLIRLFRAADQHDLDLAPEAFAAVGAARLPARQARDDPEAAEAFLELLAHGRNPERALGLMNEAGLLGRFLPEFGRIVARTQFNMYHAYTVDEHTLRVVGVLRDLADGEAPEDAGAAVALGAVKDPEVVFLAALLHDVGKGSGEAQEIAGERLARAAAERLGLEPARVERVAWLVRRHLDMNAVAQKGDLTDPATVRAFAETVGSVERLNGLLALTVADIQSVGPGVWNGWKAELLRALYVQTAAALGAPVGEADDGDAQRRRLKAKAPEAADWIARLDAGWLAAFTPAEQAAHLRLLTAGEVAAVVETGRSGVTTVAVVAPDRSGLFADLCGALAASGADVVGARAHTDAEGRALDVFHLQDAAGAAFAADRPQRLRRLEASLVEAVAGDSPAPALAPSPSGARAQAFPVRPEVRVETAADPGSVRLELTAADRPGLLAELARAVAAAGLSIRSAHVETRGERAEDVLYLRAPPGWAGAEALRQDLMERVG